MKALTTLSLLVLVLAFGRSAAADRDSTKSTWADAQRAAAYPLLRPSDTEGLRRNALIVAGCEPRRPLVEAFYGTYRGVPGTATAGFGLLEGNRSFCINFAEEATYGTVKIGDVRATLSVYCPIGSTCPLSSGFEKGYILGWVERAVRGAPLRVTSIRMDSSHLTLKAFLGIASSLIRVGP